MTERQLREGLLNRPKVFSLKSDIEFSSWLVSYGIAREVGTVNDELSRFIFDAVSGKPISRTSLHGEVITIQGKTGLRITSSESSHLEVRIKGFRALVHPNLSENEDSSYHQITIFPEIVAQAAALEGVELVIVKPWALNSIFGGYSSTEEYYATNFWELGTNDSTLFAELLQQKKLALLGTHDLIAHIAGLAKEAWLDLPNYATQVRYSIQNYLGEKEPAISDLVLPYLAGVILDDLAQPPSYQSSSHSMMLEAVLGAMTARTSTTKKALLKYPSTFEKVIRLSRDQFLKKEEARKAVSELVREINSLTLQIH